MATAEQQRDEFIATYMTDPDFHDAVDRLIWDEVVRLRDEVTALRATLGRLGTMRRDDFRTAFEYELAVRRTADKALGRER